MAKLAWPKSVANSISAGQLLTVVNFPAFYFWPVDRTWRTDNIYVTTNAEASAQALALANLTLSLSCQVESPTFSWNTIGGIVLRGAKMVSLGAKMEAPSSPNGNPEEPKGAGGKEALRYIKRIFKICRRASFPNKPFLPFLIFWDFPNNIYQKRLRFFLELFGVIGWPQNQI